MGKQDVWRMHSRMVDGLIEQYQQPPDEMVLDIDDWDDPTHGQQQLSCFHGYYGHSSNALYAAAKLFSAQNDFVNSLPLASAQYQRTMPDTTNPMV